MGIRGLGGTGKIGPQSRGLVREEAGSVRSGSSVAGQDAWTRSGSGWGDVAVPALPDRRTRYPRVERGNRNLDRAPSAVARVGIPEKAAAGRESTTACGTRPNREEDEVTKRDFVTIGEWSAEELREALALAAHLKREHRARISHDTILRGKTLAMIFQKPSLRTRVSFEVGMTQLGGHALYLGPEDIKLGKRETTEDIALNLSRYADGIMARVFGHEIVEELARYATVPVINGLSDLHHPCQALGDMLTILEKRGELCGTTLVFIGDGNNVAHSLIEASAKLGLRFRIACPPGHEPNGEIVQAARAEGAEVEVIHDPKRAAQGADVLYTDVWASMGQEAEAEARRKRFQGFTVDVGLVETANRGCLIMHCLPAHYGEEITYEASRLPNSVLFDQAENRLHAQKAVLALLLAR